MLSAFFPRARLYARFSLQRLQVSLLLFCVASFLLAPAVWANKPSLDDHQIEMDNSQASDLPLEKIRLQLLWRHQFEFAGFYAAVAKGYFREEGLEVELIPADHHTDVVQEVVQGRAEYGISNATLLLHRAQGKKVVMVANLFKHSPLIILTRRDSGIRQPEDLVGKRVMTMDADLKSAEISYMLRAARVDSARLRQIEHTFSIGALAEGRVDALTAYITNQPFQLQEMGINYAVIDPANYGADFYSNTLFTHERELNEHPDRIQAVYRATLRGWRYALDHPDEIIRLIRNRYSTEKTTAALAYEAREVANLIADDVYPLGSIDPIRIERLQSVYLASGELKTRFPLNDMIWSGAVNSVPAEQFRLPIQLSASERRFIERTPAVRLCVSPGWMPYEGIAYDKADNGVHIGISADLIQQVSHRIGLRTQTVLFKRWADALQGLKTQQCDLLSAAVESPLRQPDMSFTKAYMDVPNAVVTRKDRPFITRFSEMSGKTLGVLAGGIHEELLVRHYPDIRVERFDSMKEGLYALSSGRLDGFVEAVATSGYYIRQLGLDNLQIAGLFPHDTQISIGVRSDLPDLLTLMEKGLNAVSDRQLHQIGQRWIEISADTGISYRTLWQAAIGAFILLSAALFAYYRIRRINRELANEVRQRREIQESLRQANEQLQRNNEQLSELSRTDMLTGLSNRYAIESRLEETLFSAGIHDTSVCLLLIDLDHFKQVNDRYGHNCGDQVLREFAALLKEHATGGVSAGRWGGEEFILILPDRNLKDAYQAADSLRMRVATHHFSDVHHLTVSMGVAALQTDDTPTSLLKRADMALYQAKAAGRNRVICAEACGDVVTDATPTEKALKKVMT